MTTIQQPPAVDEDTLMEFVFTAVGEVAASLNSALVVMGDKLGWYRSLADHGPSTAAELAERTGTDPHCAREWLNAQAAGSYVEYDPDSGRYTLPPAQAVALADDSSPAFLPGLFQIAHGTIRDTPAIIEAIRTGTGRGWHEHNGDVHLGCERFFRPSYAAYLVPDWLPSLTGVVEKLQRGARVADIGCGHGASTILLAEAFPASAFVGLDYHPESIQTARERAHEAASTTASRSKCCRPPSLPGSASTSSRCSTACMTWVTRRVPRRQCASRWPTTAPGWWSSPRQETRSRTT